MIEKTATIEEYRHDYIELQKQWRKHSKELFLVGKLAYWTYWISKYAERSYNEERQQLYALKHKGFLLLAKSKYTQLRKYVPEITNKLCRSHYKIMKSKKRNTHWFLDTYRQSLLECEDCQKGQEHYYSLYSLAVLDDVGEGDKHILFVLYVPYLLFNESLPTLEELRPVKFYRSEFGRIRVSKQDNWKLNNVFSLKTIIKKFNQNYEELHQYFEQLNKKQYRSTGSKVKTID
jgi:hypothetical protein